MLCQTGVLFFGSPGILNIWKLRWLSLAGKIQVFKSLIASKPVYIATMKRFPQDVLDELQRTKK